MRRRLRPPAALLLALFLFIQLLPPAAGAGGEYLVAVNEEVLEMTQETMPFWSGGHLYVSSVIFSGSYRSLLGVAYSRPPNKPVVLYSLRSIGTALFFDLETGQAYDGQNNTYHLPAIQRGSYVFFPVDLVASVLGLTYSYTPASPAPLIRIKSDSVKLADDAVFLDAAASRMWDRYNEYIRSLPEEQTPDTTPPTAYTGQRVYLLFTVADTASARSAVDTLTRQEAQATFLLTPEQMEGSGDLIRALAATGQGIALRLTAGEEALSQAERGNELLWQAARVRTRLVWLEGEGGAEGARALLDAGYCLVESRLDMREKPLSSAGRAQRLYQQLAAQNGSDQTVFLGTAQANIVGLGSLLSRLREAKCRVIAYRETL